MEDKSISRKRLNVYKKKHLSKKKRLKYKAETIECCHLNTYNPFSGNFNNITMWLNLTFVNISSSMITILPSAFGKLRLNSLDLSQNCLGTFGSTWLWIKQNTIRNTLSFLDISSNSLTKLPFNIGILNALTFLDVSHNMLRNLPQSIGNLQNLHILDLSYNKLLYLPISMFWLKEVEYLDIKMNSFQIQKYEQNNEQNNVRVQSLVILSANIVLQHSIPYDTILPSALIEFLEEAKRCSVCLRIRMDLLSKYEIYFIYALADHVQHTFENHVVQFESYFCPFSCEHFNNRIYFNNLMNIIHKKSSKFIRNLNY